MQFDSGHSGYYYPPTYPPPYPPPYPPYPHGWAPNPAPVPQYAWYAPPSQQPPHFGEFYEASYRSNTYQPYAHQGQMTMVGDPYYAATPQYHPPLRPYEHMRENVPPARGPTRDVSNTLLAASSFYSPSRSWMNCTLTRLLLLR
ncbi:hypothetical protein C8Q74DRAFT_675753 [Fomes fomentarius]|nr:hypothetical protein C8Q74DRAFT_675753 [Fomes fomentarius]